MEYLSQLIDLRREWEEIKISGKEYAKVINEDKERRNKKREEILGYREKIIKSRLTAEDKERNLKEIGENLEYLEPNPNSCPQNYLKGLIGNELLAGCAIGVVLTILGMKGAERFKNYLTETLSEDISKKLGN
jgi:hypothetical protein